MKKLIIGLLITSSNLFAVDIDKERSQDLWQELNKMEETKESVEVLLPNKTRTREISEDNDSLSLKAAAPVRDINRSPTTTTFDYDEDPTSSDEYLDENKIDINQMEQNLNETSF